MTTRFQFTDSIYDSIVFGRTLPSKLGYLVKPHSFNPVQVIQAPEFARLSFIRRHGLAWLVYPSATQTQLEHALGNWGFARLAELLIQVVTGNGRRKPLSLRLQDIGLRAEFYLSLLCQEIGCVPLAPVIAVKGELAAPNLGRRSASLLAGRDSSEWQAIAERRYGPTNTLANVLKSSTLETPVCIAVVSFILTNDQQFLNRCSHPHRSHVGFLNDLVRGLLHIRRLDHYARDSYLSTLRQFGLNLRGFLKNLSLLPSASCDRIVLTSINKDAIDYAANILLKRKYRLSAKDYAVEVVALHEMAAWAWRAYLSTVSRHDLPQLLAEVSLMEDDQVLELIGSSTHVAGRKMIRRVRCANVYSLVGKWEKGDIDKIIGLINEHSEEEKSVDILPAVLMKEIDGNTSDRDNPFGVTSIGVGLEGELLRDVPAFKNNIVNLQRVASQSCVYVFARNQQAAELLRSKLNGVLNKRI